MYQHGAVKSSTAYGGSGNASSVACGSHYRRRHQRRQNRKNKSVDPFAASLEVAPPPYMQVQMNDMENKQGLLMEEQIMGSIQHKWKKMSHELHANPTTTFSSPILHGTLLLHTSLL
ncbi:hypothetical protein YC2023_023894 [Brassica napus]